jgi:hypothetical protein
MIKDFDDLPYGMWVCLDGSTYLFNRKYQPIYQKTPDGVVVPADREGWIKWVSQIYFYDDSAKPAIVKHMRFIRDSFIKRGVARPAAPEAVATAH